MRNLCVVSDYNFLPKGLTLYESLLKYSKDFILHYLCFDDESFNTLINYECDNLKVYKDDFDNETLIALKTNDRKYYAYTLASFFSNYLLNKFNSDITYIDSDIYFHDDIGILFQEIGKSEIGLFRHRQYSMSIPNGNGWFNVGVVYFNNGDLGKKALTWWSDAVLNKKYPELATCGDQKYLDVFASIESDLIFIDGNIGHGAPWQWMLYDFSSYQDDGCILWENKKQKLLFSHFSQFEYSIANNAYIPSTMHHCFTPHGMYIKDNGLKMIYDNYFNQIKLTHQKYNLKDTK